MQFENRLFSTEPIGPFALTNSLAGTLAPVVVLVGFVLVGLLWQDVSRLLFVLGSSSSTNRNESELRQRRWKWLSIGVLILGLSGFVFIVDQESNRMVSDIDRGDGFRFGDLQDCRSIKPAYRFHRASVSCVRGGTADSDCVLARLRHHYGSR